MNIPELIHLIASNLDSRSIARASRINRAWYSTLEPLRHQEYAIPFCCQPLLSWKPSAKYSNDFDLVSEGDDDNYDDYDGDDDFYNDNDFSIHSEENHVQANAGAVGEVTKRTPRKAPAAFKSIRHWVQHLRIGDSEVSPMFVMEALKDPDEALNTFDMQLERLLLDDKSNQEENRATLLTNLTSLTVNYLPHAREGDAISTELFRIWDPRVCFEDLVLADPKQRDLLVSRNQLPRMYATIQKLLQMNPRLSSLRAIQAHIFSTNEWYHEATQTITMGVELHGFMASLSQTHILARLTSLSLEKFEWPQHSMARFLTILRQTTPNLRELTIVFTLANNINHLEIQTSLRDDNDTSHLPPLSVRSLYLSSRETILNGDLLNDTDVIFAQHMEAKQALFSFLQHFPLLEEWHMTSSDMRPFKGALRKRSYLGKDWRHLDKLKYPFHEGGVDNMADDFTFCYFWYNGRGRASAVEFCQELRKLCPRLKSLDFSRYVTFRPIVMQAFLDTFGAQLESLDIFLNPAFDASALVQTTRICANLTTLDISFCGKENDLERSMYNTVYADLSADDDTGYVLAYESPYATMGEEHFDDTSIEHRRAIRPRYHITGREASLALWKLPHLKRFYAQGIPIDARDLLFEYDIAGWDQPPESQQWRVVQPWGNWACKGLEILAINITIPSGVRGFDDRDEFMFKDLETMHHKAPQQKQGSELDQEASTGKRRRGSMSMDLHEIETTKRTKKTGKKNKTSKNKSKDCDWDYAASKSHTGQPPPRQVNQLYQIRVCKQIGRLTRLRELILEGSASDYIDHDYPGEPMTTLSLTVETGLREFAPLAHSLERLHVHKLTDKLAGRAEVEWIANNLYRTSLPTTSSPSSIVNGTDCSTIAGSQQQQKWPRPTRTNFVELLGVSRDTLETAAEVYKNVAWLKQECPGLCVRLGRRGEYAFDEYWGNYEDY